VPLSTSTTTNQPQLLVAPGHKIGQPAPLITEIKDDVIDALRARFGGSQAGDAANAAAAAGGGSAGSKKAAGGKAAAAAGGGGKKKAAEPEGPVDVSRLDLRVGVIRRAWKHPDADRCAVCCAGWWWWRW
jgi:methionyl-tRNA synthetase